MNHDANVADDKRSRSAPENSVDRIANRELQAHVVRVPSGKLDAMPLDSAKRVREYLRVSLDRSGTGKSPDQQHDEIVAEALSLIHI